MSEIQYQSILTVSDVAIGYKNKNALLPIAENISLEIYKGEMVCLLGPNGCGKSTLIRTLAGMQPTLAGTITIDGDDIHTMNLESLAKKMSVVLTDGVNVPNMTVFDIVALGRYPHTNWFGTLSQTDVEVVRSAMEKVGLEGFDNRDFQQLSDGEKQRAMIAKALAQDTPFIMLDEPTAHLDLPNRVEVMRLLKTLARTTYKSILLSTHELDLALQVSDRIWLMQKDKPMQCGTPEDLVLNGSFERAFKKQSFDFDISNGLFKINYDYYKKISVSGDAVRTFWTIRALHRHGIAVCEAQEGIPHIIASNDVWTIVSDQGNQQCQSIFELLSALSGLK